MDKNEETSNTSKFSNNYSKHTTEIAKEKGKILIYACRHEWRQVAASMWPKVSILLSFHVYLEELAANIQERTYQ
jgi:hypothetical protein